MVYATMLDYGSLKVGAPEWPMLHHYDDKHQMKDVHAASAVFTVATQSQCYGVVYPLQRARIFSNTDVQQLLLIVRLCPYVLHYFL